MAFSIFDRVALAGLVAVCALVGGHIWLHAHPQYDPWAPLSIEDAPGWATSRKIAAMRGDRATCRAFLGRSAIDFTALSPTGSGTCRRDDRKILAAPAHLDVALRPSGAQATCAVDAGLALWLLQGVQPAAQALFGTRVVRIEHLGTVNCRRIGGGKAGTWSQHATGNAIDIAAFVLADGRRIAVRRDWKGEGPGGTDASAFLHAVRDSACTDFATVLSPDYNAAHADHLHLDQARRAGGWSACR
jgi:hypothetical protein